MGNFKVLVCISAVLVASCSANMGYGNAGVVSGASSDGNSNRGSYSRSNVGVSNSGYGLQNTAAYGAAVPVSNPGPAYSQDTSGPDDSGSDSSDDTGSRAINSGAVGVLAGASSNSASFTGSRSAGSGSNVGAYAVGGPSLGGRGRVRVVQVDSSNALDMNAQIQATIQDILNKFGIQMQQSLSSVGSGMYQPGQRFVISRNGQYQGGAQYGDQSQAQSQYQGSQSQYQTQGGRQIVIPGSNNFGQTQVSYSASQPIVVRYQLIGTPGQSSGVSFSVQGSQDQGGYDSSSAGAGSSAQVSNLGAGQSGTVYSSPGVQPVVYNSDSNGAAAAAQQQDQYDSQDSDNSGAVSSSYVAPAKVVVVAPPPRPVAYSQPAPSYGASVPVVSSNKIRYAANSNHKSQASSNVAYEQDSS